MSISICGIGTWLPQRIVTNDAWPATFTVREQGGGDRTFNDIPPSSDPIAAAILERHLIAEARDPFLGATQRHVADPTFTSAEAEALAALAALADANIDPVDVDLVLSNSMVPDRLMPSTATAVAHRVGASRALALGLDAACASVIAQLEVAQAYIAAGMARVVLLTQSHLVLRAVPLTHPARPGLGDGATALVVKRGSGLAIRSTFAVSHGEYACSVTWLRGKDDATDIPWWQAGGDFQLSSRDERGVKFLMRETVTYGAATMREAAARSQLPVERIEILASVQPRGFIPGAIAEVLKLPENSAVTTYNRIAHVGACGPVFNLAQARNDNRLSAGTIAALYGQGAGFTRAAAILEMTE